MLGKAIQPEIEAMVANKQFDELRELLCEELDAADVAELLEDVAETDRGLLFRLLPTEMAADVFELLEFESQEILIDQLSRDRVAQILNEMSPDDRTQLLEELPGEVAQRLLKVLNPEQLRVTRTLLGYPENSIGRLMTPEYLAVDPEWTVDQALEHIRRKAQRVETINVFYVLDNRGRLTDDLRIEQLLLADGSTKIKELCDEQFVALSAFEDQEEAIETFKKYDRIALPVTDTRGVMVGIVTFDDVFDVAEAEQTEDAQKFGGQEALDDPYFAVSILELMRKRVGWLGLLLISSFLTVWIMKHFEESLQFTLILPILAFFVPMIISTGGNSGNQSAAIVIRGMAVREINMGNWMLVFLRELATGLMLGVILGLVAAAFAFAIQNVDRPLELDSATRVEPARPEQPGWVQTTRDAKPAQHPFKLPLLVMLSILGVVTFGTLIGSMLPLFFKGLGFDPAVCSGPFVATFVDVIGIVFFFLVFKWLYIAL